MEPSLMTFLIKLRALDNAIGNCTTDRHTVSFAALSASSFPVTFECPRIHWLVSLAHIYLRSELMWVTREFFPRIAMKRDLLSLQMRRVLLMLSALFLNHISATSLLPFLLQMILWNLFFLLWCCWKRKDCLQDLVLLQLQSSHLLICLV